MSLTMTMILAGAAGGIAWAGVTLAATWWFNRRVRATSRNGMSLAAQNRQRLRDRNHIDRVRQ